MEVKLIVQSGKQAGKEIPVSAAKFLIGRGEECQLRAAEQSGQPEALRDPGRRRLGQRRGLRQHERHFSSTTRGSSRRRELNSGDRIRVGMLGLEVQLAVSVEGKKKPKVHSVQEAAARTVASAPAAQDDLDISGWLGDDGAADADSGPPGAGNRPTRRSPARAWSIRPPCPPSPPSPRPRSSRRRRRNRRRTGRPRASASFTPPPSRWPRAAARRPTTRCDSSSTGRNVSLLRSDFRESRQRSPQIGRPAGAGVRQ